MLLKSITKALFAIALPLLVLCGFMFVYIPIVVLIAFSFNKVAFPYRWFGFTWDWYYEIMASSEIWFVVQNSLIVAFTAMALSLIMGLFFVFYSRYARLEKYDALFYSNLLFPEVVLGVGLLSFFTFLAIPLSLLTLIAGHTILGLGYVIPILSSRFQELDVNILEASMDLGATRHQTFVRIVIPMLLPAMIASGLLVFVVSFNDFLIAFFCASGSSQTLPLYIFSLIRTGISPSVNAVSTILILLSSFFVLVFCSLRSKIRIF